MAGGGGFPADLGAASAGQGPVIYYVLDGRKPRRAGSRAWAKFMSEADRTVKRTLQGDVEAGSTIISMPKARPSYSKLWCSPPAGAAVAGATRPGRRPSKATTKPSLGFSRRPRSPPRPENKSCQSGDERVYSLGWQTDN